MQIDQAGRLVLPKKLRELFKLEGGDTLFIEAKGESIELRPTKAAPALKRVNGLLVLASGGELPWGLDLVAEEREIRIAEAYAVITRLPAGSQVAPSIAWQLLSENVVKHCTIVHLSGREYAAVIESAAAMGVQGGMTYGAVLLAAAAKSGAERIYTFNVIHFRKLAPTHLAERICSP